jgi:hypothetical protein
MRALRREIAKTLQEVPAGYGLARDVRLQTDQGDALVQS